MKLNLHDKIGLEMNGKSIVKRIDKWIEEDPTRLWELIYEPGQSSVKDRSLSLKAYAALKDRMQAINPAEVARVEQRKIRRNLIKKAYDAVRT